MKKIIFLAVIVLLAMPLMAKADLIPVDSHQVSRCVKISNLEQFPDLKLFGVVHRVIGGDINGEKIDTREYQIHSDQCLTTGYSFGWDIRYQIQYQIANGPRKSLADIEPDGSYVPNSNNLIAETIEYEIIRQGGEDPVALSEVNHTKRYKNGSSVQVDTPSKGPLFAWTDLGQTAIYFVLALIITLLIEVSLLCLLIRKGYKINSQILSPTKIIITGIIASAVTLAFMWFLWPIIVLSLVNRVTLHGMPIISYDLIYNLGEVLVIIIEALIYKSIFSIKFRSVLLISIICNIVSYAIGWIIFLLI